MGGSFHIKINATNHQIEIGATAPGQWANRTSAYGTATGMRYSIIIFIHPHHHHHHHIFLYRWIFRFRFKFLKLYYRRLVVRFWWC